LPLLAAGGDKIMDAAITPTELSQRLAAFPPPTLVDVRREAAFEQDSSVIRGALRRLPEAVEAWSAVLEPWRPVVVYCVRGHEVSQNAAAALRLRGLDAQYLEGGVEGWRAEGREVRSFTPATRWVTRERPKIDRIACPWLVRRFIDPAAEFFYVPNADVRAFATANDATPYDIPDVDYTHVGPECSFDAFIHRHALSHPALDALAKIVRAADTSTLDRAAQAPGLLAASLGLSAMFADDHAMLKWGMLVYDSLYAWCRRSCQTGKTETHGWYPEELRVQANA
jgi:rhodanese-related sulfurtransferase